MKDNNQKQTTAGISEFGKLLGVGHSAINKAILVGRIPAKLVAKRVYRGRIVDYIVDVAAAQAAFYANTNPTMQRPGADISAAKLAANAERRFVNR